MLSNCTKSRLALIFIWLFIATFTTSCNILKNESNNNKKIDNITNNTQQSQEDKKTEQNNESVYLSFEDYKKAIYGDTLIAKSKSINLNKQNNLDFDLKIGVLIQSKTQDSDIIEKEIKSTISLFLNDILNDKISIIPLYTELNPLSIKQSIAEGLSNDVNVFISTLPAGFSKLASEELYSKPTKLFISLPYIPISTDHFNVVSFGFNPNDQISTITQFAKYNGVKNISILFPNNKFGGDLSLMLNKSIDESKGIEIENAEFFTNSTKLQKVNVSSSQEQKINNVQVQEIKEGDNHETFDEQRESGLDSEDAEIKTEIENDKIKTNIPFYLNKVLYYHNKKIHNLFQQMYYKKKLKLCVN